MIKMEADDLVHIISRAGTTNHDESIVALLKENNALKGKLDEVECKLAIADSQSNTRVMIAEQKASFTLVHAERQRITKGIIQYFENTAKRKKKPNHQELLFGLALGDLA